MLRLQSEGCSTQGKRLLFCIAAKSGSSRIKNFIQRIPLGTFIAQKVLPNQNYIVRRLNTNKTQVLHQIRLKKFVPNIPLEDTFREER